MWHSQLAPAAVICVLGCAESDLLSPVEPGKYDFLDCPSVTKQLAAASYEEAKLARLMTRASEAADGALVNAIVYQDQYNMRVRVRELRKVGEAKKMFTIGPEPATHCATRELICWKQPASTAMCGRTGKTSRHMKV